MKRLINKGRRRLGIPGRPAIIVGPNEPIEISDHQHAEMLKNRTVERWLDAGILVIENDMETKREEPPKVVKPVRVPADGLRTTRGPNDPRQPAVLPDGVTGEGIEIHHSGGGWYQVFVSGFKVTDKNVRKDEAESIAKEYD